MMGASMWRVVVNVHCGSAITAWLALGFSLLSLAWNAAALLIRWPRIAVVMRQSVIVNAPGIGSAEVGSTEDKLHVIVVNNGAEAASIANVGVRSEDGSSKVQVVELREQGKDVAGPGLPARVEAHGALEWTLPYDLLGAIPQGTNMVSYIQRYQKVQRWPWPKSRRSPLRIREASDTRTKN